MAVDVVFLSFDDIIQEGVPSDIDVIINAGDAGTAWSGHTYWDNPELVTAIRQFVYNGGGFVGIGEPSAYQKNGRFFQLGDVLGIEKETGYSLMTDKYFVDSVESHFITADVDDIRTIDFGESMHNIFATSPTTEIIEYSDPKAEINSDILAPANAEGKGFGELHLSANSYGKGRGVYIAGLPYSIENTRLLLRSLYYAAGKEAELTTWFSSNPSVEVHAYPQKGKYALVNNTSSEQTTIIYNGNQEANEVTLQPSELRWEEI